MHTEPASASAWNRAATFTVSPRTVTPASVPPHALPGLEIPSGGFQPLQNQKGCATRPQGCVFKGSRRTEDGHDAIAGKALKTAPLSATGAINQFEEAACWG